MVRLCKVKTSRTKYLKEKKWELRPGIALALSGDRFRDTLFHLGALWPFPAKTQGQLINWGYALCDAAMRCYVLSESLQPGRWPVPKYPL